MLHKSATKLLQMVYMITSVLSDRYRTALLNGIVF